jgi:RNA recognition motif-containing protein
MSKDLYVKNIAREISEEELRKLFAVCGKVAYVHMVKDAGSGEFLGCAYVKMSSEGEAKDAIVTLDGARMGSREIVVVAALPQRTAGSKGLAGRGPGKAPGGRSALGGAKGPQRKARTGGPSGPQSPAAPERKGPQRPQNGTGRKGKGAGAGLGKGRGPGKPGGRRK